MDKLIGDIIVPFLIYPPVLFVVCLVFFIYGIVLVSKKEKNKDGKEEVPTGNKVGGGILLTLSIPGLLFVLYAYIKYRREKSASASQTNSASSSQSVSK